MNTPIEKESGYWGRVLHQLVRDPVSLFCMFILLTIIGACILAPLLTSYDPSIGSVMKRLKPIGTEGHFLGTDELGRDMFTRLLYGGRTSLIMGFVPVFIALLISAIKKW